MRDDERVHGARCDRLRPLALTVHAAADDAGAEAAVGQALVEDRHLCRHQQVAQQPQAQARRVVQATKAGQRRGSSAASGRRAAVTGIQQPVDADVVVVRDAIVTSAACWCALHCTALPRR